MGAGVVAVLAVAGVVAYFVFGRGGGTGTPAEATTAMLKAFQANDKQAYLQVACAADRSASKDSADAADDTIGVTSYTIGKTATVDATHATVTASVTVDASTQDLDIPVVKEGRNWKVCITDLISGAQAQSGGTTPSGAASGDSSGDSSAGSASGSAGASASLPACGGRADAQTVVTYYVIDIQVGQFDLAQDCVYPGTVARAVTKSLAGQNLTAQASGPTGGKYRYALKNGGVATLATQQRDGTWWIVGVTIDPPSGG